MTLLLVSLFLAGLAAAAIRSGSRPSARARPLLVAAVYCVPGFLLLFPFWLSTPEPRLRLALLGVGFRTEEGRPLRVSIGGDPQRHDLWVAGLRGVGANGETPVVGWLELSPATVPGTSPALSLRVDSIAGAGLLASGPGPRPVGAVELRDGDRVVVAGRSWEVRSGGFFGSPGSFVEPAGHTVRLPARFTRVPLVRLRIPILGGWSITRMSFPLAELDPAPSRSEPVAERGFVYAETRLTCGEGIRLLCSPRLWLVPGRQEVEVLRGATRLSLPSRRVLRPGDDVHVLAYPRRRAEGRWAGGAVDLRSFRAEASNSGIVAAYHTPELQTLSRSQVAALGDERRDSAGAYELAVNLSLGDAAVTGRSLYLRHVSHAVGVESLSTLHLPGGVWTGRRDALTISTPRGSFHAALGEPVWLGRAYAAAVELDVIRAPWALALLALLLAVAKALAAHRVRLPMAAVMVAGVLEALLALRLLTAFRVWAMPPHSAEAYTLALATWALLPWAFLAASLSGADRKPANRARAALPVLAGLAWSACWALALGGGTWVVATWIASHLLLGGWVYATVLARRPRELLSSALARVGRWIEARGSRFWLYASLAFTGVRVGLTLAGARESVHLGSRIALSLAHVPLAILLEAAYLAWLWRRAGGGGLQTRDCLVSAGAIVGGVWVVPSLVVSDSGLALLNVPVFLVALALVSGARLRRRLGHAAAARPVRIAHRATLATLALYTLFVAVPLMPRIVLRGISAVFPTQADALLSDRNYLRVLGFASPDELERVGRRSSEELVVMSAVLDRYTHTPPLGRGYFGSELSPHLEATSLREHTPAVFVSAEWGPVGMAGLALLYLLMGVAGSVVPFGWARWRTLDLGMLQGCALLAALTFCVPSLYLLAANLGLVVFTGKNAYLLGMDSTADVLESLALVVLMGIGFRALRKSEDRL